MCFGEVGGRTDACSGRVEIYKDSEWGTICDEGLDDVEGNLVCYEAGCGPLKSIQPSAFFGEGSGSLLTDDLQLFWERELGAQLQLGEPNRRV